MEVFMGVFLKVGKKGSLKESIPSQADNPQQLAVVTGGKMRLLDVDEGGGAVSNIALKGSVKWPI